MKQHITLAALGMAAKERLGNTSTADDVEMFVLAVLLLHEADRHCRDLEGMRRDDVWLQERESPKSPVLRAASIWLTDERARHNAALARIRADLDHIERGYPEVVRKAKAYAPDTYGVWIVLAPVYCPVDNPIKS